jgi:hypothetical protein
VKYSKSIVVTTCFLATATITGCNQKHDEHEPTLTQASESLKENITTLLSGINARDIVVTKNETSRQGCKKSKERYLYSTRATKRLPGSDTPDSLVAIMTGQATRIGSYRVTKAIAGKSPVTYMHDQRTRTNLALFSPQKSKIEVTGSTDCLNKN